MSLANAYYMLRPSPITNALGGDIYLLLFFCFFCFFFITFLFTFFVIHVLFTVLVSHGGSSSSLEIE
jgi:hypothetical protein